MTIFPLTKISAFQILVYLVALLVLVKPLGWYIAKVYEGKLFGKNGLFQPVENVFYKLAGVNAKQEMNWVTYLSAMLFLNLVGILVVYLIQRLQAILPLNPQHFSGIPPDLAFNNSISFATNTDWQAYGGETTMSYFTQMFALTLQNFLSAATGMSLLMALIRGIRSHETNHLGNFWVDTVRGILYILLPLSCLLALFLCTQGVMQNIKPYQKVSLLEPLKYQLSSGKNAEQIITEQVIPMGPVASQVAIKQLGTNGGGFFNTNSAHPLENPTPLSNFLEMLALILIPASLCYTFGVMVEDRRQGWAILAAMMILFLPLAVGTVMSEQAGNPLITALGVDPNPRDNLYPGGNMEGKETRFGIASSALWAAATTGSSNGAVNSMLDSFMPLGGMFPLWLLNLGEVVFGGLGSGLYGMLMLVIITVFVAGLMVGRTPEYLGKKIEPFEMKMASIAVLVMPLIVLFFSAVATMTVTGRQSVFNPGSHGFTEILFTFSSIANNNGSAFSGLNGNTFFYNFWGGIVMLLGRYWIAIPTLAIAGSLAKKKIVPAGLGTLPTHSPLFILMLISVTLILGALTFFPALAIGPIIEHLLLWKNYAI